MALLGMFFIVMVRVWGGAQKLLHRTVSVLNHPQEMVLVNCPSEGTESFILEGASGRFILISILMYISEVRPLY